MDSRGAMCGIRVYGLCGIHGACGYRSNVSSITLFVFPAGNTALKLLISLLHHTGKCKSTGAGCNELVRSKLRTGVRLKWRKR